jgi:hypothetical protein
MSTNEVKRHIVHSTLILAKSSADFTLKYRSNCVCACVFLNADLIRTVVQKNNKKLNKMQPLYGFVNTKYIVVSSN